MRRQLLVNGAILALALGSLGVVWLTRETTTTTELSARKNKLLPSFDKDKVSRLRLAQGERKLTLVRSKDDDGDFHIVEPWNERADIATVQQLLGALDLASSLRSVDGVSSDQAGLGKGALTIELEIAGKSAQIRLGGPAPAPTGARYAEVTTEGATRLYVVTSGVASELTIELDKLRETRLLDYGRSEIAKIELQEPSSGSAVLEQREHAAFFVVVAGGAELANRELTDRLLTALSRLTSEQFVEPEQARAAFKADKVVVKLDLFDKSVPPITLTLGAGCPKAPDLSLLLREQPGKPGRAGCLPNDIVAALHFAPDELRLAGPFAARADEIEELKLVRGSQKLELARKDSAFVMRAPSPGDVALEAGNERISLILQARGERSTASAQSLGLEPPAGEVSVQVAGASEASHREEKLLLGKARPDGSVCAKRQLDGVVLCFDKSTARAFEPDASLLRSLAVWSFAASELVSFAVESSTLHERVRRNGDASFQLEEPKGFVHDGSLVTDAVQTLGALQAARWVAASDDPSFGLSAPRLRVTITPTTGAPRELLIGAETSDGYFARLNPDPAVFVLPRVAFADLSTPLIDRALCRWSKEELTRVELKQGSRNLTLTREGEAWQGNGVSNARAAELVEAVSALRAEQALHLGAARPNEGFGNPTATVTSTDKTGQRSRLRFGARDTLGDSPIVYARRDDVDATFAVSRRAAEDLQGF